jgi:hypothetical protein
MFAGITLAAMTVAAGAGAHAWRTNGGPWRYDADIAGIAASLPAMKDALFARSSAAEAAPLLAKGKVNAVILGDSLGANLLILRAAGPPQLCPLYTPTREILYFDWRHWSPAGEALAGAGLKKTEELRRLF